jgi:peptidoglycan/LPS O-acetylase OafA/YrhL
LAVLADSADEAVPRGERRAALPLSQEFSTFLDLVRLVAAFTVFLGHLSDPSLGGEALRGFLPLAKSAVIAFFVLSGYVIAWSAQRDGTATQYAVNRAARIYSVALPALLLTWGLDLFLRSYDPALLRSAYQLVHPWKYLPLFVTFTSEFWFLNENAFSNIPFWSLSYEVWYYVVFGILVFARGPWRWWLSGVVLLLMGPRLWLLFPTWLLGVAICRFHEQHALPRGWARPLLVLGAAAMIALKWSGIDDSLNDAFNAALQGFPAARLRYSQNVVGDTLFALAVGTMILAARDARLSLLKPAHAVVAALASVSFSLYLVHFPLLLTFGALMPRQCLAIALSTLAVAIAFGMVFERRKRLLRRWLLQAVKRLQSLLPSQTQHRAG